MAFIHEVAHRAAKPLVFIVVFVGVVLVVVPLLFWMRPVAQRQVAPTAPICNAACHAQGLAQIQARIDAKVAALSKGRKCYPVDPPRLTKYVIVRKGEVVYRMTLDAAFKANTDHKALNDVWVLARCN